MPPSFHSVAMALAIVPPLAYYIQREATQAGDRYLTETVFANCEWHLRSHGGGLSAAA